MSPKITVLMSVYHGEKYLREAIDSVVNQTYSDFEFIIINDNTKDSSVEIIESFKDSRIRLIHNEANIGLTKSLNKGIGLARGQYIARMDADDVSLPERFERQVQYLDERTDVILVVSNIILIDDNGCETGQRRANYDPSIVAWRLLFYNCIMGHSGVMFRRAPVLNLGGYSEACRYSQDYELWSRLAELSDIAILPEPLLKYRCHDENVTTRFASAQRTCSFSNTQTNIRRLVGEEFSFSEVSELRNFFYFQTYLPVGKAASIHRKLKRIYEAFMRHRERVGLTTANTRRQVQLLVAKKFLLWCNEIRLRANPFSKLTTWLCAFTWDPLVTIKFCLKKFRSLLCAWKRWLAA